VIFLLWTMYRSNMPFRCERFRFYAVRSWTLEFQFWFCVTWWPGWTLETQVYSDDNTRAKVAWGKSTQKLWFIYMCSSYMKTNTWYLRSSSIILLITLFFSSERYFLIKVYFVFQSFGIRHPNDFLVWWLVHWKRYGANWCSNSCDVLRVCSNVCSMSMTQVVENAFFRKVAGA
jgi:hypothetical protein